jgi:pimeloyl-ACP methyl ester carboxylesterase
VQQDGYLKVETADGRTISVETSGAAAGRPVVLFHGTPGSRSGPKPRSSVLYRLGVRLITYDRPGYGDSDRLPGRSVVSAADDVRAIVDRLELEAFSVVGRSGGGPHALACAAALGPKVVNRAAVMVSVAPADATGLDWFDGMVGDNVGEFSAADDVEDLTEHLTERARTILDNPDSLVEHLRGLMTPPDRRVVADGSIRRLLAETYTEALKSGPYGWIDDIVALRRPWGFELADIESPVLLWHGAEDNFAPVGHTRWMAEHIPGAKTCVQSGAAHFGAMEILPDLLNWLLERTSPDLELAPAPSV